MVRKWDFSWVIFFGDSLFFQWINVFWVSISFTLDRYYRQQKIALLLLLNEKFPNRTAVIKFSPTLKRNSSARAPHSTSNASRMRKKEGTEVYSFWQFWGSQLILLYNLDIYIQNARDFTSFSCKTCLLYFPISLQGIHIEIVNTDVKLTTTLPFTHSALGRESGIDNATVKRSATGVSVTCPRR